MPPRDPAGRVIRNLVALQRLGTGVSREAEGVIRALYNDIVAEIARIDPGSGAARRLREARIDRLIDAVEDVADGRYAEYLRTVRARMVQIGVQQGTFAEGTLRTSIGEEAVEAGVAIEAGVVSPDLVRSIVDDDPFEGKTLAGWTENQKEATVRRVRRQVQLGMANEETVGDIVRRVRGTQRGRRFVGGVMESTTRETEAIVRTAINHVSNSAHRRTFAANSDILQGVQYTATLDERTTMICAGLDGTVWPAGSDKIQSPPQHYQCRSVLTPQIDYEGMGIEPPEGTRRPAKRYKTEDGKLVELDPKQVSASTDYESWFRSQPADVQDQIIGPSRAKLFRDRKVDFREMVTRDGRPVQVSDLPGGEEALEAVGAGAG